MKNSITYKEAKELTNLKKIIDWIKVKSRMQIHEE